MPALPGWRRGLLLGLLGVVWIIGNTPAQTHPAAPPPFREGRLLVKFKPTASGGESSRMQATHRTRRLKQIRHLGNVEVLQLPADLTVADAIRIYQQNPEVEYAEPDYLIHAAAEPNDPFYTDGTLWGLHNTGQNGGTAGADINAPAGWDTFNSASNIIVAVVDSGVRYTHQDLAANMWVNPGEIPDNGLDDDHDGYVDDVHGIDAISGSGDPNDNYGHGTHVAGIIGAVGNNGLGVAGVAWHAQIMALKFLDNTGNGVVSDMVECLDYARQHGAKIINASWGDVDNSITFQNAFSQLRDAGILVVTAAGNSGGTWP